MPRSKSAGGKPEMTWESSKRHHHLRWVFPTNKKAKITKSSPQNNDKEMGDEEKALQPNVINEPEDYVFAARKILYR